ncbi:MAG: ATP-binding protein, partial [Mycobacterium sp.]
MHRDGDRLLERDVELSALDETIVAAAAGEGALAVIEGAPGIGKTVLLAAAQQRARAAGLRVLSARGGVLEREYPFGVVRRMLEPAVAEDEDPPSVAADSHLALGDATLAVLDGLHGALVQIAAEGPVLVAIDDAHWADAGSLRFLCHLAGRLDGLPIALVVACRPREPGAHHDLLAILATDPTARLLRPAALSQRAVGRLLAGLAGEPDPDLVEACLHATAGNPLLVSELVRALTVAGAPAGGDLSADALARLAPEGVARLVLLRLSTLPAQAATVARGLAVLGGHADTSAVAELVEMDVGAVAGAADLLGDADLIARERPLEFRHPLVRATIYQEIAPSDRERMHARAARLLAAAAGPSVTDAVAAHLLQCDPSADRWVADRLVRAAERALAHAAPDTAVSYLRRACAEPPPSELRAAVLVALGEADALNGHTSEAIDTFTEALARTGDAVARADIARRLSQVLLVAQRGGEAAASLLSAIAELPDRERELGLELEAELLLVTVANPDGACLARNHTARFRDVPVAPRTRGDRLALAARALDELAVGSADEAAALAKRALGEGALLDLIGAEAPTFAMTGAILTNCGHLGAAADAFTAAIDAAGERCSVFGVALSRCCRAEALQRMGRLAEAEQDARAGLEARRLGMRFGINTGAASLVIALIEQGRLRDAEAVLKDYGLDGPLPDAATTNYLQRSRARLRLEQGEPERALADRMEAHRRDVEYSWTNPVLPSWPTSPAIALLALGREDEARECAAAEVERARTFGSARDLGIALTVAGQVDDDAGTLADAADVLAETEARLEQARALCALGASLRRNGRPSDARRPLRAALRLA